MIDIEDLKDSLRHQLGALIALYEAERDASEVVEPMEVVLPATLPPVPDPRASDATQVAEGDPAGAELARALAIETCLVSFDAAIRAAERAARARDHLQRAAHEAIARSITARRVATGLRHDLQRMILASGRVLGAPAGDDANRGLDEVRLALRRCDVAARHADREALAARRRAELAIAAASAALLAAVQADPARGNTSFDPVAARAARAVAERAAEQAESSLADSASTSGAGAEVIAFRSVSSSAPGKSVR
jgi:hypothetical protein